MEYFNVVITTIISIVIGMGMYIMRTVTSRIDTLEQKMDNTVTKQEVRQLLDDKINPLKEDIKDIKYTIDKLLSIFIKGFNNHDK
jgi:uncharacterized protein YoxC